MKFSGSDLRHLILPLVGMLILAIVGAVSALFAEDYLRSVKARGVATEEQLREIRQRLARATEEEKEIRENLFEFQALVARGIIGDEVRLDWVDAITALKAERRMFSISYNIEPQRELDYPGFGKTGAVKFLASRMKMSVQLLHENDLLGFIDELDKRTKPYLAVRRCDVRRAPPPSGTTLAPRLDADCEFDMITIRFDDKR